MPKELITVVLFATLSMAAFLVYAFRSMRRGEAEAALLKKRIAQNPGDLEMCELAGGDPITVYVTFRGEPARQIPAVAMSGVVAAQYFESLKALAPAAHFVVTQNGRAV